MFDRIAGVYDLMNTVMTAGMHRRWRERAAELARLRPGARALDVATGTGDFAVALARRAGPEGEVVGSDFSEAMLERARRKAPGVRFEWGNALELPYGDGSFDAVTVGFGARNLSDLDAGLREMVRVTRPGGRVVVLEITAPARPPLSWFFRLWFDRAVPLLGRLAGDPDAYAYLPRSVRRFPGPRELAARMAAAGLVEVRYLLTAGGIIAIHSGTVPRTRTPEPLRKVLAAAGPELGPLLERVEARLAEVADGHGEELGNHALGTLAAGGKRLRPLLVLVCAGAPPAESDGLLRAAVAVELLHMATLVHDDVLDRSHLRRGRPTVWGEGGRLAATATGDLLFSRAFAELVAGGDAGAVRDLSGASSALARGELAQRADAWSDGVTVERYLERCELKTARLFEAACRLGARFGEPGAAGAEALGGFGLRIGMAFQLLDDVLDVSGPPERTGKPRGADLLDGTVTLPLIVARERDPELRELEVRTVVRDPAAAAAVCERVAATGALDAVRERAYAYVSEAKSALSDARLTPRQREALGLVADGVVERYS